MPYLPLLVAMLMSAAIEGSETIPPPVQDAVFITKARDPVGPYYPEAAIRARMGGEAILECQAKANGVLTRCRVVSETPRDYGFGPAARIMADRRNVRAPASTIEGEIVRVRVPFVFGAEARSRPSDAP